MAVFSANPLVSTSTSSALGLGLQHRWVSGRALAYCAGKLLCRQRSWLLQLHAQKKTSGFHLLSYFSGWYWWKKSSIGLEGSWQRKNSRMLPGCQASLHIPPRSRLLLLLNTGLIGQKGRTPNSSHIPRAEKIFPLEEVIPDHESSLVSGLPTSGLLPGGRGPRPLGDGKAGAMSSLARMKSHSAPDGTGIDHHTASWPLAQATSPQDGERCPRGPEN